MDEKSDQSVAQVLASLKSRVEEKEDYRGGFGFSYDDQTIDPKALTHRWKALLRKYHPDKCLGNEEKQACEEITALVNQAYDKLKK